MICLLMPSFLRVKVGSNFMTNNNRNFKNNTASHISTDASQELSPIRQRRPSKKVKEAEEDNKIVDEVLSGKKAATPSMSRAKVASPSTATPTDSRPRVASPSASQVRNE